MYRSLMTILWHNPPEPSGFRELHLSSRCRQSGYDNLYPLYICLLLNYSMIDVDFEKFLDNFRLISYFFTIYIQLC